MFWRGNSSQEVKTTVCMEGVQQDKKKGSGLVVLPDRVPARGMSINAHAEPQRGVQLGHSADNWGDKHYA